MSDTLTAPTGAAPVAPVVPTTPATPAAPVAPSTFAEAGAALKNAGSWDDLNFGGMDVIDGEDTPETPVAAATPEAGADEGPEFVQNAQGQWHRPDGTFANADEIAQIEAQIAATPAPTDETKPTESATENVVTLRTRDGKTRDVIIEDPELAQEIRQNMNDGMRRKEYTERVTAVDAKLAHLSQVEATLQESPETFVYHSLTDEQRVQLGVMLLARDFERLVPIIRDFDSDPSKRIEETAAATKRVKDAETHLAQMAEGRRAAGEVRTAIEAMIPEGAPEADVSEFMTLAGSILTNHIQSGTVVNATTAPQLISNLASKYGFTVAAAIPAAPKPRITAAPNAQASTTPAVAQPANDAAKALAEAKDKQRRIRLQQANRRNAAAVPPAGAGAAPVRLPPVPQNATIEEAARAMKQHRSWAS